MLKKAPLWAIVPAQDVSRARKFYAEKVGLTLTSDAVPGTLMFSSDGDTGLVVYEKKNMTSSDNTVAGWNVKDLDKEMQELRDRGVVFEEYNMPNLKTVNGVASFGPVRSAWFKDSEGNILAINQM